MRTRDRKILISLLLALALLAGAAVPAFAAEPVRSKVVAMTFDDGPNTTITPQLLDALAERNVKCTFFVLGRFALNEPEIVQRAYEEGHQIASHTYNHMILPQQSNAVVEQEVQGTRNVLRDLTGEDNFMVRLPYGASSNRVLGLIDAPVILWSVDPTNGKTPYTEESLYNGILRQVHDGAIILLHDSSNSNMNAALRAIDTLQAEGWTFVTVEELFRIKNIEPQNGTIYYGAYGGSTAYDESRLTEHWAWESIGYVQENGLMQGDGAGFKPNEYLSRAMAVTILWRACGQPEAESGESSFADVSPEDWYAAAVAWGRESGVVQGLSDTVFAPEELVSREQFCLLLMRLAALRETELPRTGAVRVYCDAGRVSAWAAGAVEQVWNAGFVSANDTSAFRPQDSLTRAEAAELLSWYLQLSAGEAAEEEADA